MDKRYRVVPPLKGIQPASALLDRIYTEIPADRPDHPTCYEGEWLCSHAPCPVRMVRLRVKALFHQHLPQLRCPLCLRTLEFRSWLNIIALQEVPPEAPVEKAGRSPRRKGGSRAVSGKTAKGGR
ncbi:MAG TPA: hypothetical protein VMG10_33795 [Gemmataceae bacterium]|nr:hypothetical protein [Gemmataceae bacterium]